MKQTRLWNVQFHLHLSLLVTYRITMGFKAKLCFRYSTTHENRIWNKLVVMLCVRSLVIKFVQDRQSYNFEGMLLKRLC